MDIHPGITHATLSPAAAATTKRMASTRPIAARKNCATACVRDERPIRRVNCAASTRATGARVLPLDSSTAAISTRR